MRTAGCTLAGLLVAAPLFAQQQPPAGRPTLNPVGQQAPGGPVAAPVAAPVLNPNDKLDNLLMQWEQKMKAVEALMAQCKRTEKDPLIAGKVEEYQGWAKFQRPSRAHLYMEKKGSNAQIYERFLSTGTFLYEYRPQNKLVRIHELPPRKPGQGPVEDNFLSFLLGMEAREAKRRYDMQLVVNPPPKPEDPFYHYLYIRPRFPQDRADFTEARLILWKTNLLPRQISFIEPNGKEVMWDIPQLDTTARLAPSDFQPPPTPTGWAVVKVPPAGQPPPAAPPGPPGNVPPTKVRQAGP